MAKILGYLIAFIGILILATSQVPQLKEQVPQIPEQLSNTNLLIIGGVIAAIGIFLIVTGGRGGSRGRLAEVPIFQGKNVIGYRRH